MNLKRRVRFFVLAVGILVAALPVEKIWQRSVRAQTPDNLTNDVILVPVPRPAGLLAKTPASAAEPLRINATFANNVTSQQRAVFQRAINEWLQYLLTSGLTPSNYSISFANGPLSPSSLALTDVRFYQDNGDLDSASIIFSDSPFINWYVDANPATDEAFSGTDLLSVARHEIGHALGWADTRRVTPFLAGGDFDPTGLNIAVDSSNGRHTNASVHSNDLMNPGLPPETRCAISAYPMVAMLARAFEYDVPMRFVDAKWKGVETGSAREPWNTVREGAAAALEGGLLIVIPGIYSEMLPLTISKPVRFLVPRGGSIIVK